KAPAKDEVKKPAAPTVSPPAPSGKTGSSSNGAPNVDGQSTAGAAPPSVAANTVSNAQRKELKWWRFTSVSDLHDLVGGNFDVNAIHANVERTETNLSVPRAILFGLLGGLILNIMPCVLPVIGLKILSFVQQSGHSRGKAFALNVWYSAGLLAVF